MNLILNRNDYTSTGVFGTLKDENDNEVCVTLEHAYSSLAPGWFPKVPLGTYECQRGQHQLASMTSPFETFQIMDVPGHSNILFHCGNLEDDSEGCVLLGTARSAEMVTQSRAAFAKFMALQNGCDSFTLIVQ